MPLERMPSDRHLVQYRQMRSEIEIDICFHHLSDDIYKKVTEEMPRGILGKLAVRIFNQHFFL